MLKHIIFLFLSVTISFVSYAQTNIGELRQLDTAKITDFLTFKYKKKTWQYDHEYKEGDTSKVTPYFFLSHEYIYDYDEARPHIITQESEKDSTKSIIALQYYRMSCGFIAFSMPLVKKTKKRLYFKRGSVMVVFKKIKSKKRK